MKIKQSLIFVGLMVMIAAIIFFAESDKKLATYKGGSISFGDFFNEFDERKFAQLNYTAQVERIRKHIVKKLLFSKYNKNTSDQDSTFRYELTKISNDAKLAIVFELMATEFKITDSLLNHVIERSKKQYTIQDIVVTHHLSYSQHQDRTRAAARKRAETILRRLNAGGITFDDAVSIYTEEPSMKIRNAKIGPFGYGIFPLALDSVIWKSKAGDILGPIESKFGFHIINVLNVIPNDITKNPKLTKQNIRTDIKQGKYGLKDAHADKYAEQWLNQNNLEYYYENMSELWQHINSANLFIIPHGVPFIDISTLQYKKPLAAINDQDLTFDWFLENANLHENFKDSYIVKGYYLNKLIKDLIIRHLAAIWVDSSNLFDHRAISKEIEKKQKSYLYEKHIEEELKKDPKLTETIILNRFLMDNNVQINH